MYSVWLIVSRTVEIMFIIVGFFIFVSTCILEWVFSHLEGMCSDCK